MANPFEEVLASIGDEPAREALKKVAEEFPQVAEQVGELRKGYMRQADYSRGKDEARAQLEEAERWKKWREENWVDDHYGPGKGAMRREIDKDRQIEELRSRPASGGDDVTFEELNQEIEKQIKARNIVTRPDLESVVSEKEKAIQEALEVNAKGATYVALTTNTLARRHEKEFGEELDALAFIKAADEAKQYDLPKFYDSFVAERRTEALKKTHEVAVAAARDEGRKEGLLQTTSGPKGPMPVDYTGPEMGHLQARLMAAQDDQPKSVVSSDATLDGSGRIAREAARHYDKKEAEAAVA